MTQGIGVAAGLQDKFSWAGVAAAAVGYFAGGLAPNSAFGIARAGASLVANAATRSLAEGTSFGDNIIAALPDVIGQTIGEAIAGGISQRASAARNSREAQATQEEVQAFLEELAANAPTADSPTAVNAGTTSLAESDRLLPSRMIRLKPGQSITLPTAAVSGDITWSSSDTERVLTNNGEDMLSVLLAGRVHDSGAVDLIVQRYQDGGGVGTIYSAPLQGETGIYNFASLNLTVTDRLIPGVAAVRWLAETWRNASPGDRQLITAAAQMPGAFSGLIMQAVSPEAAQGMLICSGRSPRPAMLDSTLSTLGLSRTVGIASARRAI